MTFNHQPNMIHPFLRLFAAMILLVATVFAAPFITDAEMVLASQASGELMRNHAAGGEALSIGGKVFSTGLGTRAVSEIPVSVPDGTARFSGAVGVDDSSAKGKGGAIFRILSGNGILWESPTMARGDAAAKFDIPVSSNLYRKLYLQVSDVEIGAANPADWVDLEWISGESPQSGKAGVIDGAAFGLKAGSTNDQTLALGNALQALRVAPGSTMRLEKGEYHFHSSGSMKRHFHISNHEQPTWHPVSIPLVDLRNVTIDGQGSLFLFHGEVLPVLIQDSVGITLRGIAMDYVTPHHSQGMLTKVEKGYYEMTVDQAAFPHAVKEGWLSFKGEGWETRDQGSGIIFDGATHGIVAGTSDVSYIGKLTALSPGHYRVEKDLASAGVKAGDVIAFRQDLWKSRPHPAVSLCRAGNVSLENFVIHSSHGMGLVAQRSWNIRMSGGGVYPRKETGRYFSTNADATHFSNCRGDVSVENCLFEGMMDDAINVHATCLRIDEVIGDRTIRCKYVHEQSFGFETFLTGETLRFIQAKWLEPGESRKVDSVRKTKPDELLIKLTDPVPAGLGKGDAVENADWFPSVGFRGNTVRNNRARGSLFTTPRPVVVEGNRFESVAGSAILLAGDANGWYESGCCGDVLIRNNVISNNLTSRFQFTEALISIYPEIPDLPGTRRFYHRNVRIEDNTINTFDVPLVFAISTQGLKFAGNQVTYNSNFPGWNLPPFILKRCEQVEISGNRVIRDGKPCDFVSSDVKAGLSGDVSVK